MIGIMRYFGPCLLVQIREAYQNRFNQALERGFDDPANKYFWIYDELRYRLNLLYQAFLFLDALPKFICEGKEIEAVRYVIRYSTRFFLKENCGSVENEGSQNPFFNDGNEPYRDFTEAINHFDMDYDLTNHPLLYVDLSECVVRAVRLYLQIRERKFHAIDRANFNALIQAREQLPAPA